jgi:adenylate kinase family enzyme
MNPTTVVFFGKSGSGKGTQAALLLKTFERLDPVNQSIYVDNGSKFRAFVEKHPGFMAKKIKDTMGAGKFLPAFIPIWSWAQFLIEDLKTGKEHLIFDGMCRQPEEGVLFEGALKFIGDEREKPYIILLDVHHTVVTDRLLKRGRFDDKHDKIAERLKSYETLALPSIKHFEKSSHVNFVVINGDQAIEKVHEDILKALGIQGRL